MRASVHPLLDARLHFPKYRRDDGNPVIIRDDTKETEYVTGNPSECVAGNEETCNLNQTMIYNFIQILKKILNFEGDDLNDKGDSDSKECYNGANIASSELGFSSNILAADTKVWPVMMPENVYAYYLEFVDYLDHGDQSPYQLTRLIVNFRPLMSTLRLKNVLPV